mgnify:CR=1 FL=1
MSLTLTKGFATWKDMLQNNAATVDEYGCKIIFAGTEAGDDIPLHVIMEFESPESLESFKNGKQLAQKRIDAAQI